MATLVGDLLQFAVTMTSCVDFFIKASKSIGRYIGDKVTWVKETLSKLSMRKRNQFCGAVMRSTEQDVIEKLLKPVLEKEFPDEKFELVDLKRMYKTILDFTLRVIFKTVYDFTMSGVDDEIKRNDSKGENIYDPKLQYS